MDFKKRPVTKKMSMRGWATRVVKLGSCHNIPCDLCPVNGNGCSSEIFNQGEPGTATRLAQEHLRFRNVINKNMEVVNGL